MPQANTKTSRVQLARLGEVGADFYNSYLYLTQISALYAHAAEYDQQPRGRELWRQLSDGTLDDLGDVYNVWDAALKLPAGHRAPPADAPLGRSIVRACERAAVMLDNVNVWTGYERWIRLLTRCERQWQRLMKGLATGNPGLASKLESSHRRSLDRSSRLTGMAEKARRESLRINGCFGAKQAAGGEEF